MKKQEAQEIAIEKSRVMIEYLEQFLSDENIAGKMMFGTAKVGKEDLCIVDITGKNANVMYECGRRHETGKPTILMAENGEKLPFDINIMRTIFFDLDTPRNVHKAMSTLQEFVDAGNQATKLNIGINNVTEEETYAAFDAIGVPRNTDGHFEEDSVAPYSSDGMVTFARAIRLEKMNTHTNVFEWLTGDKPRTVSYMFEHADDYQVGQRNSTDYRTGTSPQSPPWRRPDRKKCAWGETVPSASPRSRP